MSYIRKKFVETLEKSMEDLAKMTREEMEFTYDGIVYPTTLCSSEVFKALESFEARSDDVILAGYCKSGTNWVGQIITDLVITSAKKHEPQKLNEELLLAEFPYLEIGDPEKYQRMKTYPSRRVIFTHLRADKLPESVLKNKAKILLLIRNPKDVATSYYHFYNGLTPLPSYKTFDDFFPAFMKGEVPWGSYFDYIFEWNKHVDKKNLMAVTYEELKENKALGVKKISEFFELHLTDEEIQGVIDRSSFQAMKENSRKTHGAMGNVLFRKGSVSDWKSLFSEDHNQKMDMIFEERLSGTKLGEKLKYGMYCIAKPEDCKKTAEVSCTTIN